MIFPPRRKCTVQTDAKKLQGDADVCTFRFALRGVNKQNYVIEDCQTEGAFLTGPGGAHRGSPVMKGRVYALP